MLTDTVVDAVPLVLWGVAETAVTIIAASIPVLRVLVRDVSQSTRDFVRSKNTDTDGNNSSTHSRSKSTGEVSRSFLSSHPGSDVASLDTPVSLQQSKKQSEQYFKPLPRVPENEDEKKGRIMQPDQRGYHKLVSSQSREKVARGWGVELQDV